MNEAVELTKTKSIGHIFLVTDPYCRELADTVVSLSKDGSLHCEQHKNVLIGANLHMRVIQCGQSIFQFLPDRPTNTVNVTCVQNITMPD